MKPQRYRKTYLAHGNILLPPAKERQLVSKADTRELIPQGKTAKKKQDPRIINIPRLCWEINKVSPAAAAECTENGFLVNKTQVKIAEGRAEYRKTILRFSDFRDLLDNLILDRVLTLTSLQKQYLITGYNKTTKKKKGNEQHKF